MNNLAFNLTHSISLQKNHSFTHPFIIQNLIIIIPPQKFYQINIQKIKLTIYQRIAKKNQSNLTRIH